MKCMKRTPEILVYRTTTARKAIRNGLSFGAASCRGMLNPWLFNPFRQSAEGSPSRCDTTLDFSYAQFKANAKHNRNAFKQQPVTALKGGNKKDIIDIERETRNIRYPSFLLSLHDILTLMLQYKNEFVNQLERETYAAGMRRKARENGTVRAGDRQTVDNNNNNNNNNNNPRDKLARIKAPSGYETRKFSSLFIPWDCDNSWISNKLLKGFHHELTRKDRERGQQRGRTDNGNNNSLAAKKDPDAEERERSILRGVEAEMTYIPRANFTIPSPNDPAKPMLFEKPRNIELIRAKAMVSYCMRPFTPYLVTRGISSLDMNKMDSSAVFVMLLNCLRKFGNYKGPKPSTIIIPDQMDNVCILHTVEVLSFIGFFSRCQKLIFHSTCLETSEEIIQEIVSITTRVPKLRYIDLKATKFQADSSFVEGVKVFYRKANLYGHKDKLDDGTYVEEPNSPLKYLLSLLQLVLYERKRISRNNTFRNRLCFINNNNNNNSININRDNSIINLETPLTVKVKDSFGDTVLLEVFSNGCITRR